MYIINPNGEHVLDDTDLGLGLWSKDTRFCSVTTKGYIWNEVLPRLAKHHSVHIIAPAVTGPSWYTPDEFAKLNEQYPRFMTPHFCFPNNAPQPPRGFLIPASDEVMERGIEQVLNETGVDKPFAQRKPRAVWRGTCEFWPDHDPYGFSVRRRFLERTIDNYLIDAFIIDSKDGRRRTEEFLSCHNRHFTPKDMELVRQLKYRFAFAIEGDSSPSNLYASFAGGQAPFLISRFTDLLLQFATPWEDFIPFDIDLVDLEMVMEHGISQGEKIANNAQKLARSVLTPTFLSNTLDKLFAESYERSFPHPS